MKNLKVVGQIIFGGRCLSVYDSLEDPLFLAVDVAELIDYSIENTSHMLNCVEMDEKKRVSIRNSNTKARGSAVAKWFVTELGLYNILSQSRKPIARGWRRIVHMELIRLRKSRGKDVVDQFEDWDHQLDDFYFDEATGVLMQSVTIPGGDVVQVPVEEDE